MDLEKCVWNVKNGDLDSLKSIVESGNSSVDLNSDVGGGGRCLLHYAADFGQVDVIQYLLTKGANVNQQDKHGLTPLHNAAYEGHVKCVHILIEKGALVKPMPEDFLNLIESDDVKKIIEEKLKSE